MAGKPLVTREQLCERVAHDYPAERVEDALSVLDELRVSDDGESGNEYFRMAVLRLVYGWFDGLQPYVDLANQDPRDLLVDVHREYGTEWDVGFVPSETRKWK